MTEIFHNDGVILGRVSSDLVTITGPGFEGVCSNMQLTHLSWQDNEGDYTGWQISDPSHNFRLRIANGSALAYLWNRETESWEPSEFDVSFEDLIPANGTDLSSSIWNSW